MIPCHLIVVLFLLNSYWFHQWPGFCKPKQPLEKWRLTLEISLVHVLDWQKCMGTCLLSQVCCSLIFSSVCFFPCPYFFTDRYDTAQFASHYHLNIKIWNLSDNFLQSFTVKPIRVLLEIEIIVKIQKPTKC